MNVQSRIARFSRRLAGAGAETARAEEPPLSAVPLPEAEPRRVLAVQGSLGTIALSANGRYLAASRPDGPKGLLRVWDLEAGTLLLQREVSITAGRAIAFSPDGSLLAAGGWGTVSRCSAPRTRRIEAG
jgi:hypothetical protein